MDHDNFYFKKTIFCFVIICFVFVCLFVWQFVCLSMKVSLLMGIEYFEWWVDGLKYRMHRHMTPSHAEENKKEQTNKQTKDKIASFILILSYSIVLFLVLLTWFICQNKITPFCWRHLIITYWDAAITHAGFWDALANLRTITLDWLGFGFYKFQSVCVRNMSN